MEQAEKNLERTEARVDRMRAGQNPNAPQTAPKAGGGNLKDQAIRNKANAEIMLLKQHFPNAKLPEQNSEVWQEVGKGVPLVLAYAKAEIKRLEKELDGEKKSGAAREQNEKNRERTVGSMKNTGGQEDGVDDFLRGFNMR